MKRVHVFYSGNIQGIGFRYAAQDFAQKIGINGWIKNLSDGRVEIVAEGQERNLEVFLNKVREHFQNYIKDVKLEWQKPIREWIQKKNFEIKFD